MFLKTIQVRIRTECQDQFLVAQKQWIDAMQQAPGFLGCSVVELSDDDREFLLLIGWSDEQDYRRWMRDKHDAIAQQIRADRYYENIETKLFHPTTVGNTFRFVRQ